MEIIMACLNSFRILLELTADSGQGAPADLKLSKESASYFGWDQISQNSLLVLPQHVFTEHPGTWQGLGVPVSSHALCCLSSEEAPMLVINKKGEKWWDETIILIECFRIFRGNPLRSNSEVLKYHSHLDLTPIEFGRYSLTTRVLIETLENTSGQFHYLMALGFSNAS